MAQKKEKRPVDTVRVLSSDNTMQVLEFPDLPLPQGMGVEDLISAMEKIGLFLEISISYKPDAEAAIKRNARVLARLRSNHGFGSHLIRLYGMYYDGPWSDSVEKGGKRQKHEALLLASQLFLKWAKGERDSEEE